MNSQELHLLYDGCWATIRSSKLVGTMSWDPKANRITGQTRAWGSYIFIYPQGYERATNALPNKRGKITSKPFIKLRHDEVDEVTFLKMYERS